MQTPWEIASPACNEWEARSSVKLLKLTEQPDIISFGRAARAGRFPGEAVSGGMQPRADGTRRTGFAIQHNRRLPPPA